MTSVSAVGPGLMLSCELEPRDLIHLAQLAEDLGYKELWYTDQRFWRDCYAGLTLVAQHTRHIRLGPGVNDPFTRHPATIAMAIATLDELSGGRAQLGLGAGGSGIAQMRLPKQRPVRALREAIELIRLMLTSETAHYAGELFTLDGGRLGFQPARSDIPIFIATHSPQTLRLCGRMADGVLLGNLGRREVIERAVEIVRAGERDAGRPPGSVAIHLRLEAIISDDRAAALNQMKKRLAQRLTSSYPNWDFLGDARHDLPSDLIAAAAAKDADSVVRHLRDADVRATALVGTAAETVEQLAALLVPEVNKVTIRPHGFPGQGQAATIRAFAEYAWPTATAQWMAAARAIVEAPSASVCSPERDDRPRVGGDQLRL